MEHNMNDSAELEQMRQQMSQLRSKIEKQAIINEQMIVAAIRSGVGKLNRSGVWFTIFGVFAVIWCTYIFSQMDVSRLFVVATGIFLLICVGHSAWTHFELQRVNISRNNLLEIGEKVMRLRRRYINWYYFAIPAIILWMIWLYWEFIMIMGDSDQTTFFLIGITFGGVIGGIIGNMSHRKTIKQADEILQHILDIKEQQED